jgi:O-antigen/teichoic acid export membrane protein
MSISLAATCVNILMNILLIPRIGVTGAGIATLGAYAVTIGLALRGAPATLRPKVNVPALLRCIVAAAGMVIWLRISEWNAMPGVIGILYLSLLVALDRGLRRLLVDLFKATHNSLRLQVAKYTS